MPVNKVVYSNNTLIDLTSDTVTADTLSQGITAHDKTGTEIVGSLSTASEALINMMSGNRFDITASEINGLTEVAGEVFSNNQKIRNVELPDTVQTINGWAFAFSQIEQLTTSAQTIGDGICASCTAMNSITLKEGVTTIGMDAFASTYVITITVPSTVVSIGSNALDVGTRTNGAIITFLSETPPTLDGDLCNMNRLEKIIVPQGCSDVYKNDANFSIYSSYIVEAN